MKEGPGGLTVDDLASVIYEEGTSEAGPQPEAIRCATCNLDLFPGERVIQFLDGLLAADGGMEDVEVESRKVFHYECFFPEEAEAEGEAETPAMFEAPEDER